MTCSCRRLAFYVVLAPKRDTRLPYVRVLVQVEEKNDGNSRSCCVYALRYLGRSRSGNASLGVELFGAEALAPWMNGTSPFPWGPRWAKKGWEGCLA